MVEVHVSHERDLRFLRLSLSMLYLRSPFLHERVSHIEMLCFGTSGHTSFVVFASDPETEMHQKRLKHNCQFHEGSVGVGGWDGLQ